MTQPLVGVSILVTRPAGQEVEICSLLRNLGATVYHWPALTIEPVENWSAFDVAIQNLEHFEWTVFTSANGVRICLARMNQLKIFPARLESCQIAAIGPATAHALRQSLRSEIVLPDRHDTAGLIAVLKNKVAGKRVALFRAEQGRTNLRDELAKISRLHDIIVYRQRPTSAPSLEIQSLLESGSINVILLSSGNGARAIFRHLSPAVLEKIGKQMVGIVVNSVATAEDVSQLGAPLPDIADGSTDQELVTAVGRYIERRRRRNSK